MKENGTFGWEYPMLRELIDFAIGGDWGKDSTYENDDYILAYCIRGSEFRNWKSDKGNTASLRKIKRSSSAVRKLCFGDILLEISGGGPEQPVGRTVLIDNSVLNYDAATPKICTNFLRLLRPKKQVSSSYLNYYLQSFYKSGEIIRYQAGSNNLRNLKFDNYMSIRIPLPPLNEQKRIVAKIEELFSELDKGIESLKTAREQLKVYRQAVLKHAFEGKLTAEWRERNKDKLETAEQLLERIKRERDNEYQSKLDGWETTQKEGHDISKPRKPKELRDFAQEDFSWLPDLPDEWLWERLGWMTCGVEYGSAAKSSKSGKVPVLRMGNIQNMKFDWSDLVYTSDTEEITRYSLRAGDVLFNRTNSPELVGKTAIFKGEMPAIFAGYLIRINQIERLVDGRYLNFYLNSYVAKQYGNRVKTDGVNQSNINGERLAHYPFPYCSMEEQKKIVSMLEAQLSLADQMEDDIALELQKSEALRQSILKKAFSGKLVAQDPNDEPASVLLERIRTGREAQEMEGRKPKYNEERRNGFKLASGEAPVMESLWTTT